MTRPTDESEAAGHTAEEASSAEAAVEAAVDDGGEVGSYGDEEDQEVLTVEGLLSSLESCATERDRHLDDLQRVSADFANFRKQTQKRNADLAAHASARLAEALLPVLDACDAASQQGVDGVEPIGAQLLSVLQREGLEVIADETEPFDPNRHEAAMSEPGDDDQQDPVVVEVLRTGYAWNDRVLRAAMVKVKG